MRGSRGGSDNLRQPNRKDSRNHRTFPILHVQISADWERSFSLISNVRRGDRQPSRLTTRDWQACLGERESPKPFACGSSPGRGSGHPLPAVEVGKFDSV